MITNGPAIPRIAAEVRSELSKISTALEVFADMEAQDVALTIEMVQEMLSDLLTGDRLDSLSAYVRRYCTAADGDDDEDRITEKIRQESILP